LRFRRLPPREYNYIFVDRGVHGVHAVLKGAQSWYFELFWPHTKVPFNGRKPENNSLIR